MNCSEIQEQLYAAESLSDEGLLPDLASHLRACPACAALRSNLVRLEAAAHALPSSQAGNDAKEDLLRQLQPRRRPATQPFESPLRLRMRRGWQASAVAAAILLVMAGTAWIVLTRSGRLQGRSTGPGLAQATDSSVVDKLVDLNVDLAEAATPEERNEIFASQSAPLTATLEEDHLSPEEKELASKLLENGKWLSSNTDPLDEAERFDSVAGLLFDRLQAVAPAGDAKAVARVTRRYGIVAARLNDARAKLARHSVRSPEQKRRYRTDRSAD